MSDDRVRDGRHLMNYDQPDEPRARFWADLWLVACALSRPRMPRHFFDAEGRLHVTLPPRFHVSEKGPRA